VKSAGRSPRGALFGVDADYVCTGERQVSWNETGYNINLSYNPAKFTYMLAL